MFRLNLLNKMKTFNWGCLVDLKWVRSGRRLELCNCFVAGWMGIKFGWCLWVSLRIIEMRTWNSYKLTLKAANEGCCRFWHRLELSITYRRIPDLPWKFFCVFFTLKLIISFQALTFEYIGLENQNLIWTKRQRFLLKL